MLLVIPHFTTLTTGPFTTVPITWYSTSSYQEKVTRHTKMQKNTPWRHSSNIRTRKGRNVRIIRWGIFFSVCLLYLTVMVSKIFIFIRCLIPLQSFRFLSLNMELHSMNNMVFLLSCIKFFFWRKLNPTHTSVKTSLFVKRNSARWYLAELCK